VWDLSTGRQLGDADLGSVARTKFSPDGRRLATVGRQRLELVAVRGDAHATLERTQDLALFNPQAFFSRDGTRLRAGAFLSEFAIGPQQAAQRACRIAGRNLTRVEWNQCLPGRPYAKVCSHWALEQGKG
jgi:hypothetical protein